jgi:hypothetical protein
MTENQRKAFERMAERFTRVNTASPEIARATLVREGINLPNGRLAPEYGGKLLSPGQEVTHVRWATRLHGQEVAHVRRKDRVPGREAARVQNAEAERPGGLSRLATSFVLGYHGCDEGVGRKALEGGLDFLRSDRDYDWLGPGAYFWESDPVRALEWAREKAARGDYDRPFVIGAVIDLGNCLDLLVRENMEWLEVAYRSLTASYEASGQDMPQNRDLKADKARDKLLRFLDCAVIRRLHSILEDPGDDVPPEDRPPPLRHRSGPLHGG